MRCLSVDGVKNGFFVGDFEPSAFSSDHCEIAYRKYVKGSFDGGFYRDRDTQILLITSGSIDVDGKEYSKGSIVIWEPLDIINIFAIEESEVVLMKFPGTKGDVVKVGKKGYDEATRQYNHYLDLLACRTENNNRITDSQIDDKELSVVVQGYADYKTVNTIKSIREHLPGSHIILSTWEECDLSGMEPDEIVVNKDPGGVECCLWEGYSTINNCNRQIVSSQKGLEKVKTKYAMKLRSDMMVLGNDILSYIDVFPTDDKYKLFSNRLLVGELYTKKELNYTGSPNGTVATPFHPSDWFTLGHTDDLRLLYDNAQLVPVEEMGNYKCKNPGRVVDTKYKYSWRYAPEQAIFLNIVRTAFPSLAFDDWTDWSDDCNQLSEKIIMGNFTILSLIQSRIVCQKYESLCFANSGVSYSESGLITNSEWMSYLNVERSK